MWHVAQCCHSFQESRLIFSNFCENILPAMSECFDWTYPGLNHSHFHSLANLLALRNGGQAEPLSSPEIALDADWYFDDAEEAETESIATGFAHKISDSGHEKLKRKFLDCLAEFASNEKGGAGVACSAMKEGEDNVTLWIARNDGFSDTDKVVFNELGKMLGSFCDNDSTFYMLACRLPGWMLNSPYVQPVK